MKHHLLLALFLFLTAAAFAQAPNKFRYQAVAREQSGAVITGNISIRLSFLEDSENGTQRYAETHNVTTNAQGVFDLSIGSGTPVMGNLDDVVWKGHNYWLKVEMKTPGASNFTEMGKTQLLSVPYAMYAAESGSGGTNYIPGPGIVINGNLLTASDPSPTNELQTLTVNGNQLHISDGNTVALPVGPTYTPGQGISIFGNVINATDNSPENELQTLTVNGNQLSISDGNSVTLPTGTTYTGGLGIQINGNTINAIDASPTNEIQTLSLNGSQLSLSNGGGSVQLPAGGASQWTVSGNNVYRLNGNVGIGTSQPNYKLAVLGDSEDGLFASSQTGYGIVASNTGPYPAGSFHSETGAAGSFYSNDYFCILAHQGSVGSSLNDQGILLKYDGYEWKTYIDFANDYNFAFNNSLRAWIYDTDGSYHNSSDRRLKKDIQPFDNVLPRLTKLQAYTYHMKDAAEDSPISVGFMAQEVEEQFPQLVVEKEGFKTLCYDHFAVLSVQAIKEQQTQIEALKKENEQMRNDLEQLKAMVQKLSDK